jgi:hypothetical protein
MYTLVYKYLLLNHHVYIPGVGNFKMERIPAEFDFINKIFHPPFHKIIYSTEGLAADKKFYSFLASEKNVNEVEAIQLYNDFAYTLKNNIYNETAVDLPGVGTLLMDQDEGITYIPAPIDHASYLPKVSANLVIRKDVGEHFITVGDQQRTNTQQMQEYMEEEPTSIPQDKWWVFAVILAIIGISAIVYYYYSGGKLF